MNFVSLEINRFTDYLSLRRANIEWSWQQVCSGHPGVLTTEERLDLWTYLLQSLPFFLAPEGEVVSRTEPEIPLFKSSETSPEITSLLRELHPLSLILLQEIHLYQPLNPSDSFLNLVNRSVLKAVQNVIESNVNVWEERQRASLAEQQTQRERTTLHVNVFIQEHMSTLARLIHDARGSLGLVSGAAALLSVEQTSAEHRTKFHDVLERNLVSVEEKLTEILQNSRITPSETMDK